MILKVLLLLFPIANMCNGVIYHLNDSEYERMPPLFIMDSDYHNCLMKPGGVYCVAKFDLHGDPDNELFQMIRNYSQHDIKHYNHSYIDRAVCITQSCKKFTQNKTLDEVTELNRVLEGCINETIYTEYGLEAKLAHIYSCDKHGDRDTVDHADWILGGILTFLLAMNIIGSIYDVWCVKKYNENIGSGNPYLLSFSVFRNWENLTSTKTDVRYERLSGIHGLKSIMTFFVVVAHVMWLVGIGYTDNPKELEMSHERVQYQIIFGGMVIVQVFFVISGCLLAFYLQLYTESNTLTMKDVPKILFLRWARVTPANAMVLLFTGSWLRHAGCGPLWQTYVVSVVRSCRAHWWQHLLYFNNYVPQDKYCGVQTWHLATELQLFTVGVIVYVATGSRRRLLALAALALAGVVAPALHVWLQDLDALVMFKPEFYRVFENATYRSMHVLGHNNVACYAIGMAVGLVSYHCIKNNIEYSNSKLLKFLVWCVPLSIVAMCLSGALFYVDGERPHVALRMAYAAIQRPALGILTALLLLNLVLKFESGIRGALEWRCWMFSSKLCYSVFLLHVNLIHVLLGTRTQLGHISFLYVVISHFGVVSLTFAASIPFYIMLEAPLTSLIKVFVVGTPEAKLKKIK